MPENLRDHRRVLNTRDDLDLSSALRAGRNLYAEHPLQPLRPAHGPVELGRRAGVERQRRIELDGQGRKGMSGLRKDSLANLSIQGLGCVVDMPPDVGATPAKD